MSDRPASGTTPKRGAAIQLSRLPGSTALRLRFFSSSPNAPRARRPTDVVLLIVSLIGIGLGELIRSSDPGWATAMQQLMASVPGLFGGLWEVMYRLVAVWAAVLLLATLVRFRPRLLRDQVMAIATSLVGVVLLLGDGTSLGEALSTTEAPGVYPAALLAVVTTILVTTSPHLIKPARRTGRTLLLLACPASVALQIAPITGLVTGLAIGACAAAIVHLLVGSPGGRPTPEDATAALTALGIEADHVQEARLHRRGVALMQGRTTDGRGLLIKVYGRDAWDGQLLAGSWSYLWYRDERLPLSLSRLQLVEHEAFLTLLAERAGAPVLPVVAAGMPGADAVLALEADGIPFDEAGESVGDGALREFWLGVTAMHAAGIGHGALESNRLLVAAGGAVRITDFSVASAASSEIDLLSDRAQLLVTTALSVGTERALATAVGALGEEAIAEALPFIQPAAVTSATRRAVKMEGIDLDEMRAATAEATAAPLPDLVPLRRVTVGSVLTVGLLLLAAYAVISAISGIGLESIVEELQTGNTALLLLGLAISPSIQVAEAVSTLGSVKVPIRFAPVLLLQFAIRFISLAVPSSAARVAMSVRFFQRSGLAAASAIAVGAIDSLAGFVVQIILLLVIVAAGLVTFDPSAEETTVDLNGTLVLLLTVGFVLVVIAVIVVPRFRRAVAPRMRELLAAGRVLRRPGKVAQLFGGNLVSQLIQALILGLCLDAFGQQLTLAEIIFVNTVTSLFAGLVPVPGGIGVYEATMAALLVGLGIPESPAIATALAFRLITFYLPPIWGAPAMRKLRRDGNL